MITETQFRALEKALRLGYSFALFAQPGEAEYTFWAQDNEERDEERDAARPDGPYFFISAFAADEDFVPTVRPQISAEQMATLTEKATEVSDRFDPPYVFNHQRAVYEEGFKNIVAYLKKHGGKIVLSRCVVLASTAPLLDVVKEYFDACPDTFRYICYTPQSGVWFGATPELLLSVDYETRQFKTMALAGTLPVDTDEEWDEKNMAEHSLVADYIQLVAEGVDIDIVREPITELRLPTVKHLCTPMSGKFRGDIDPDIFNIINEFNPTPAVAGFPVDDAIEAIEENEPHNRRYYAGVVGVSIDEKVNAYVNLRCASVGSVEVKADDGSETREVMYNIYGGGGLMPTSKLDNELDEIMNKIAPLYNVIDAMGDVMMPWRQTQDCYRSHRLFPENYELRNCKK